MAEGGRRGQGSLSAGGRRGAAMRGEEPEARMEGGARRRKGGNGVLFPGGCGGFGS